MKTRNFAALLIGATLLMPVNAAFAQKAQEAAKPGMMEQMKAQHQEMMDLMKNVMESMAAMQNEKDPAALKSKMAAHAAMLEQMRTKMAQHGDMMGGMMDSKKSDAPPAAETDHSTHH